MKKYTILDVNILLFCVEDLECESYELNRARNNNNHIDIL